MSTASENGISVVIPCLDEQGSITRAVEDARKGIDASGLPGEVIVVDNGSQDGSAALAEKAGARVLHEPKRGYGQALRKGFAQAKYSILVMGDGDLTYDLTRLPDLVEPILQGDADFVIGNRMDNMRPGSMPAINRHIGNPLLTIFLRLFFGCKEVHDSQCGLRAIRKEAYEQLHCVTTGMEFASEMIIGAVSTRLRIREREIVYHPRVGKTKLRPFSDGWRHLRFMLLCSPSMALVTPAAIVWLLTMFAATLLAVGPLRIRGQQFDIHTLLLLGLVNIVSIQVLTSGMIARAYAHLSGFRPDPIVAWFYENVSFASASTVSTILLLIGGGGILLIMEVIGPQNFSLVGNTDALRLLLFCVVCIVNGVQLVLAAYLFSMMALPRHLDSVPSAVEDTATRDLS